MDFSIFQRECDTALKYDVWVVGCGTLGTEIIKQLRSTPSTGRTLKIVAETKSVTRKECIENLGVEHRLRDSRSAEELRSARTVIICLPPSCSSSYDEEVEQATTLWKGKGCGGNLIFTSSIGVYGDADVIVTESSPVNRNSASAVR